jgi:hypothetical protein
MRRMEIVPGEGVAQARIGEHRDAVERRIGPPVHPGRDSRAVYDTQPQLIISYRADETVEVVEIGYDGEGGEEVYYEGVQLTYRFMDEVVAELAALGLEAEPFDIGYVFRPGFTIWSMGSRWAGDLDPDAVDDDPRRIVEGVGIAPYGYFDEPAAEETGAVARGGDEG